MSGQFYYEVDPPNISTIQTKQYETYQADICGDLAIRVSLGKNIV
jgi:hypothetical protein